MASASAGADVATIADLSICDREPIHVPGAIQPHGLLLIANASDSIVVAGAGAIEERLAPVWQGRTLDHLLGEHAADRIRAADIGPGASVPAGIVSGLDGSYAVSAHRAETHLLIELEPVTAAAMSVDALSWLEAAGMSFERSADLAALCQRAATAFRDLTGFGRVMVYRFLDDEAGMVMAEDRAPGFSPFLNHRFPATDIPKQARALYVRNRIRVIPDVDYVAAPIRGGDPALAGIDLSDVGLRSVSPIHLQYMKNMGVRASASMSIVTDGLLWGMIACHHDAPRMLSNEVRASARALATGLARQIRAREEAEAYRERLRLRVLADSVVSRLGGDLPLGEVLAREGEALAGMLAADGFALVQGDEIVRTGLCPDAHDIRLLARWIDEQRGIEPFHSHALSTTYPPAAEFRESASGVVALSMPGEQIGRLLWFRAEELEEVNWAGNPHKAVAVSAGATLTPRASFASWSETVRGRARRWTTPELEAAHVLKRALQDARQTARLRTLNRELGIAIEEKDALIRQKDFLIKEVNHRVQNSLQLVSAFLGMQAKTITDPHATSQFDEAQRRLAAVALVHRRLYHDDQIGTIDLARYIEELCDEMRGTMGTEWGGKIVLDLAPIAVPTDRAVNIGLILTELVINANKYAYGGKPGPIAITLEPYRNKFRLIVADEGVGGQKPSASGGFGTRMMRAMIDRLAGVIEYAGNDPGMRVIVTAPVGEERE